MCLLHALSLSWYTTCIWGGRGKRSLTSLYSCSAIILWVYLLKVFSRNPLGQLKDCPKHFGIITGSRYKATGIHDLIWYYLSCFPKYIKPVKCRDFLLCTSRESFVWKAILHSLHTNFMSGFASLPFLKERTFIYCVVSVGFLKCSLTWLIQLRVNLIFRLQYLWRRGMRLSLRRTNPHFEHI